MMKKYSRKYFIDYQTGGSNFYLPCDITHYTCKNYFFFSPDVKTKIENIIGPSSTIPKYIGSLGYEQDGFIQLYDGRSWVNIITNPKSSEMIDSFSDEFQLDNNIKVINLGGQHEQDKGGNFIGAPDGSIVCVDGMSDNLRKKLAENYTKEIIELKCSFKAGGNIKQLIMEHKQPFRHIDEIMCFMPYGKDNYKIWFYQLEGLDKSTLRYLYTINKIYTDPEITCLANKIKELKFKYYDAISEQDKFTYQKLSEDPEYQTLKQTVDELRRDKHDDAAFIASSNLSMRTLQVRRIIKGTDEYKTMSKNIDELKTEIDSYDNILEQTLNKEKFIITDTMLDTFKHELEEERKYNLNIISTKLFGKHFDLCMEKFVFFPYDPSKKSLFNRTWCETTEKPKCLFTEIDNEIIRRQISDEMQNVFSYISGMQPEVHFVKTGISSSLKEPKGTLHCLIKQRFIKPPTT